MTGHSRLYSATLYVVYIDKYVLVCIMTSSGSVPLCSMKPDTLLEPF